MAFSVLQGRQTHTLPRVLPFHVPQLCPLEISHMHMHTRARARTHTHTHTHTHTQGWAHVQNTGELGSSSTSSLDLIFLKNKMREMV